MKHPKKSDSPFLKKASGQKPPTRAAALAQRKHGGLGRVGRGLDGLIAPSPSIDAVPAVSVPAVNPGEAVLQVPPWDIERSPWQPRTDFGREQMEDLVESIRQNGVIEPLVCRRRDDGRLELVCGERRQRAAVEAGLKLVPVIVRDLAPQAAAVMTITENLQRDDLNPIDEATGFRTLRDEFNLTYEEVAERVGKKGRSTIANAIGLLELPEEVQGLVRQRAISVGHAKVLQGLYAKHRNVVETCELAKACAPVPDPRTGKPTGGMSVRELEKRIARLHSSASPRRAAVPDIPEGHLASVAEELRKTLGFAVRITSGATYANGKRTKGVLEIDFVDNDGLDRLLAVLGVKLD